jgi:hypothetical protein
MFRRCVDGRIPIYLHTDGHILEIIPDLIKAGVTILNPELRANGLDALAQVAKGKVVLHVEVDAQLLAFASPSEIASHVEEIYDVLHMPAGGLMLLAEFTPDVPLENAAAALDVLEKVCNPPQP